MSRWRVKTSQTQARQIHLSKTLTDSDGKAERSRGWIFLALGFRAAGFRSAAFLAGLRAGFVFFVGMEPSVQIYQSSRNVGQAFSLRTRFQRVHRPKAGAPSNTVTIQFCG